jgi:hypothetical protein
VRFKKGERLLMKKKPAVPKVVSKRVSTSETNLMKAGQRILSQRLVSTEIEYLQRTLGATATQEDIDTKVGEVRKMKWSSIALPD